MGLNNVKIIPKKKREVSFEDLLKDIGHMTDKILENTMSPRSKERAKRM